MKNYRIEMKWAAVFSAVAIVWLMVEKLTGLHDAHIGKQPIYAMLFALPAFTIYVLALMDKKANAYSGQMSWKEGMISGVFLTVFVAVLSPVVQWIGFTVISPDFFNKAIANFTASGKRSHEEAQALFNMTAVMRSGVSTALSMGVITAALVALIVQTKTKKP